MSGDAPFARDFFARYVQGHDVADYDRLLARAGFIVEKRNPGRAWLGDLQLRIARRRCGSPRSSRRPGRSMPPASTKAICCSRSTASGSNDEGDSDGGARSVTSPAIRSPIVFVDRSGAAKTGARHAGGRSARRRRAERAAALTPAQKAFRERWLGSKSGRCSDAIALAADSRRGDWRHRSRAKPQDGAAAARRRDPQEQLEAAARGGLGTLETRLAGVVVAALKEAFDRDTRRLDLETRAAGSRARARGARAATRAAASGRRSRDRPAATARRCGGGDAGSGRCSFPARLMGGAMGARVALGGGWLLLLGAIAMSFVAQSQVAAALDRVGSISDRRDAISSGIAGAMALWLIVLRPGPCRTGGADRLGTGGHAESRPYTDCRASIT